MDIKNQIVFSGNFVNGVVSVQNKAPLFRKNSTKETIEIKSILGADIPLRYRYMDLQTLNTLINELQQIRDTVKQIEGQMGRSNPPHH
ncbi:hypothetical protein GFC29_3870 (plasmid) [Anoxybacillus sp. B7M1]|uniref:hypothetical protein n=1 Tax=Anoxybacillus sp. B7M1 TaxID=1490057 RepID=UPI0005CD6A10|nr:hypothetical protein [Anoxybacillus sp. B7M1]ANB66110.1 hypothetical protein GFC29_3870 [Anoxybacillus sp. B7M1]